MEHHAFVSVIVITYHRNHYLRSALESIYSQEGVRGPVEVIVIDNGGDAGNAVLPSPRAHISVQMIVAEQNLGVAGGRNLGMRLANGRYLIFIDDDAVWHDTNDMARILSRLEADARCGCVAVKVLDPRTGSIDRRLLPMPDKSRLARSDSALEAPYYYGCAHGMRAEAISRVGAYPERLVYGMEELDLSLRLIDAGYTIIYDPDVAVLHYEARSGREFTGARYWTQQAINKSRVAWRQLPMPYPVTIGVVWSAATLVKTRRPDAALQIWRTLWRERGTLRAERKVIAPATVRYLKRVGARLVY